MAESQLKFNPKELGGYEEGYGLKWNADNAIVGFDYGDSADPFSITVGDGMMSATVRFNIRNLTSLRAAIGKALKAKKLWDATDRSGGARR